MLPREDGDLSLQTSYISPKFGNDNTRYAENDQTSIVNLGPVASFSEAKLTTCAGKRVEFTRHRYSVLHA